jgi:negative regulator of replication initiation
MAAQCVGDITASTRLDQSMCDYIDDEAERLGVSKAEFLRRLLDFYRESRENETNCPHCGDDITIPLE